MKYCVEILFVDAEPQIYYVCFEKNFQVTLGLTWFRQRSGSDLYLYDSRLYRRYETK